MGPSCCFEHQKGAKNEKREKILKEEGTCDLGLRPESSCSRAQRLASRTGALLLLLLCFSGRTSAQQALLQQENLGARVEMLTYVVACPTPDLGCQHPKQVPLSSTLGLCMMPQDGAALRPQGAFAVTWSNSPSLPAGTTVAICTRVELWASPNCTGSKLLVGLPEASRQVLQGALRGLGGSGEGDVLLRLGTSGPFRMPAPILSLRCTNLSTWKIPGGDTLFEGQEEIVAALTEDRALAGHKVSLNVGLLLATVVAMAVFAVFGAAFAYIFKDSLSDLVVDEADELSTSNSKENQESSAAAWFDPTCSDWEASGATSCKQASALPSRLSWVQAGGMLAARVMSSRWSAVFLHATDTYGPCHGSGGSEMEAALQAKP